MKAKEFEKLSTQQSMDDPEVQAAMERLARAVNEREAQDDPGVGSLLDDLRSLTQDAIKDGEERGFTLRRLHELSGVHYSNLSQIANGKLFPSAKVCHRILRGLGIRAVLTLSDVTT